MIWNPIDELESTFVQEAGMRVDAIDAVRRVGGERSSVRVLRFGSVPASECGWMVSRLVAAVSIKDESVPYM